MDRNLLIQYSLSLIHIFWGTWVFNTKEVLDEREDFESYDERFLGFDHPDSEMDIYIPIK